MYKPAQFVTHASKFLDLKKEAKSVEKAATELREIESQRQSRQVTAGAVEQMLKTVDPNPMKMRTLADLLGTLNSDPAAAAALHLSQLTKFNPISAQLDELTRTNQTVTQYLEGLTKPNPFLSAYLESFGKQDLMEPDPSSATDVKVREAKDTSVSEAIDVKATEDLEKKEQTADSKDAATKETKDS
ncbi:MAG: hypothetical protein WAM78_02240 [Candidatus Sulfotelmatobacter sp.]